MQVLHHHTSKDVALVVLNLADIVLLECLCTPAHLRIVFEDSAFCLAISLDSMETATELKRLFLVLCPILSDDRHIAFLHKHSGGCCACSMVRPGALRLRTLEASALLGPAVQALEVQAGLVDARHVRNDLLVVDSFDVRLW